VSAKARAELECRDVCSILNARTPFPVFHLFPVLPLYLVVIDCTLFVLVRQLNELHEGVSLFVLLECLALAQFLQDLVSSWKLLA
jgi:hypothetical protein